MIRICNLKLEEQIIAIELLHSKRDIEQYSLFFYDYAKIVCSDFSTRYIRIFKIYCIYNDGVYILV
jgi:hypothetical protein